MRVLFIKTLVHLKRKLSNSFHKKKTNAVLSVHRICHLVRRVDPQRFIIKSMQTYSTNVYSPPVSECLFPSPYLFQRVQGMMTPALRASHSCVFLLR